MLRLFAAFALLGTLVGPAAAQITVVAPPPSEIAPPTLPSDRLPWSLSDVTQAAVALHRTAQDAPASLPHFTVGSRSVFSRLTAATVLDGTVGLDAPARIEQTQRAVDTYEQILLLYARAQRSVGGYDVEIAELSRMLMRASARLAADVGTLPAPEGEAEAFGAGVARVRSGLAEMLRGVVAMAADADVLSEPARERLLRYAAAESRTLAPLLPENLRVALAGEIAAAADAASSPAIATGFRSLGSAYAAR